MARRALARLAGAAVTLLLIGAATFALARASVGDPIAYRVDEDGIRQYTAEQRESLIRQFRLDLPWYEQYVRWLADAARGDWGRSFKDRRPVRETIAARLPPTLALNAGALVLMLGLAVPLGAASAYRAHGRFDRATLFLTLAAFAVPTFWLAMLLQRLFAVRLGWLPLYGLAETGAAWTEQLRHGILPSITLAVGGIAYLSRFVRAHLLEHLPSARARAVRARGRTALAALVFHGFRSAAVPMLTLAGFLLPGLVSGSVLVETVFAIPGLGRLFYESILQRDLPVLTALVGLSGAATLLGIVFADLLYLWAEPRLRQSGDG